MGAVGGVNLSQHLRRERDICRANRDVQLCKIGRADDYQLFQSLNIQTCLNFQKQPELLPAIFSLQRLRRLQLQLGAMTHYQHLLVYILKSTKRLSR